MNRAKILKAIADETRMKILTLLLRHNYCVRALANELELTEATISQHLKVLREAGLLIGEKHGYFRHYSVERSVLHELAEAIKALAAIEREAYRPAKRDDCPAVKPKHCSKKDQCSNKVKEFYHGTNLDKEDRHYEHYHCDKS